MRNVFSLDANFVKKRLLMSSMYFLHTPCSTRSLRHVGAKFAHQRTNVLPEITRETRKRNKEIARVQCKAYGGPESFIAEQEELLLRSHYSIIDSCTASDQLAKSESCLFYGKQSSGNNRELLLSQITRPRSSKTDSIPKHPEQGHLMRCVC